MQRSSYARRPAFPVGITPAIVRRAIQVLADQVTAAADVVHTLAEVPRNGAPQDPSVGDRALAAFMAWEAAYARLMTRLAAYRMRLSDDAFRPEFRRPSAEDVLDSLDLSDDPEIRAGVAAWARTVDAAIILGAGFSDGQRVLPAFVAPWGYNVLAWCGHRWNMHGLAEGPKTPHCPICLLTDDAPFASGYYVVPVTDSKGFRSALRGYRHRFNVVPSVGRYEVAVGALLEWRTEQEAVAARGFVAPLADSPRPAWPAGWAWAS